VLMIYMQWYMVRDRFPFSQKIFYSKKFVLHSITYYWSYYLWNYMHIFP
jgi:hypothetical protein